MVRPQVVGILESFISNRIKDFVQLVFRSKIKDGLDRHMLFAVNQARAWFDLERPVVIASEEGGTRDMVVPRHLRLLARKMMHHLLKRHRKPSMRQIGMVVDARIAELQPANKSTRFDLWLKLNVFGHKAVQIPLISTHRLNTRKGERCKSFQLNCDRRTGEITVGVITDMSAEFARKRLEYEPRFDALNLDFGTKYMFATQFGDLLGRGFQQKLEDYDQELQKLVKHLNRIGKKPRESKKFKRITDRVRGYITTEVNRVLNALVKLYGPKSLVLGSWISATPACPDR